MPINAFDIDTALRDLHDLIRDDEPDPARRAVLFRTFLAVASDIGQDGFEGAAYAWRRSGATPEQIGQEFGVAAWTASRWTNDYAERHGLTRLGRPRRVTGAVRLQTLKRE